MTSEFAAQRLPVAAGRVTSREVWATTAGHRIRLITVAILGVISAAAGLVFPATIGYLVDRVQAGTGDLATILWALAVMAAASVIGAVGGAVTTVLAARSYHAMLAELRERLVAQAMTLPQALVERTGTGDLVSRSSDDVAQIADAAPAIIPAFTATGFTITVTLAGMTALDPWYGLAAVIILPVYLLTVRWYLRTAPRIYAAERSAMTGRAQELIESQRGYETVLGFGLGDYRHGTVLAASWRVVGHSLRAQTVQNMFFGRLNLAEYLGLAAILSIGYFAVQAGSSTVGAATAAVLLFLRLFGPINQLLFVIDVLQSVAASLNRIVGVITTPAHPRATLTEALNPGPRGTTDHVAGLSGVDFSHDGDRKALEDVALTLAPGERVAVVGASGAGKSTLAGILAGIHDPDTGTVTAPKSTALITQEVYVFAGSIRDNLTLAAPAATDEQIHQALKITGVSGLLEPLERGLDTGIGAGGIEVTAAHAQQLALARLILADPELAILDEATAEAGSADASLLDGAAEAALQNRTALVIAHRLSQAATCDRILVMDAGRIVEEGTHQQLIAASGVYAQLWEAWVASR